MPLNTLTLVILTGPPASGKLTIASKLAEETGYVLFPNHATIDYVASYLPQGTGAFFRVVDRLREDLVGEMLGIGRSVLFTFAYSGQSGDTFFLLRLCRSARARGARILNVRLACTTETLLRRVSGSERRKFRKVVDPEALKVALERHDYNSPVPRVPSLNVDTERHNPASAVQLILASLRQ